MHGKRSTLLAGQQQLSRHFYVQLWLQVLVCKRFQGESSQNSFVPCASQFYLIRRAICKHKKSIINYGIFFTGMAHSRGHFLTGHFAVWNHFTSAGFTLEKCRQILLWILKRSQGLTQTKVSTVYWPGYFQFELFFSSFPFFTAEIIVYCGTFDCVSHLWSRNVGNLKPKFANLKALVMDAEDLPWALRKWMKEHTLNKSKSMRRKKYFGVCSDNY